MLGVLQSRLVRDEVADRRGLTGLQAGVHAVEVRVLVVDDDIEAVLRILDALQLDADNEHMIPDDLLRVAVGQRDLGLLFEPLHDTLDLLDRGLEEALDLLLVGGALHLVQEEREESGSGKSTLLRCATMLETIETGDLEKGKTWKWNS